MQSKTFMSIGIATTALVAVGLLVAAIILNNRANLSPDAVAGNFYQSWLTALEKAPPSPIERNLHTKSTYVTSLFGVSVSSAAAKGMDQVLCLGTTPGSFSLSPATITTAGDRAVARFSADSASGRVLLITDERGWWRIDEVDCDTPMPIPTTATTTPSTQ
jgi:undecaprenyl pyrophosphate phosphatase UppP